MKGELDRLLDEFAKRVKELDNYVQHCTSSDFYKDYAKQVSEARQAIKDHVERELLKAHLD